MDVYMKVREKALPIIKSYSDDLIKYDKQKIGENLGVPFLHFTGDTGTYLCHMIPAKSYPAKGCFVPYLFGKADREHILREFVNVIKCMKTVNRQDLILYFDGENLIEINQEKAESIAVEYKDKIYTDWRREKNNR